MDLAIYLFNYLFIYLFTWLLVLLVVCLLMCLFAFLSLFLSFFVDWSVALSARCFGYLLVDWSLICLLGKLVRWFPCWSICRFFFRLLGRSVGRLVVRFS